MQSITECKLHRCNSHALLKLKVQNKALHFRKYLSWNIRVLINEILYIKTKISKRKILYFVTIKLVKRVQLWYIMSYHKLLLNYLFTTFTSEVKQMWHRYKYVLKHLFRQDGHERLNMDQQFPNIYTDNFSCYLIVWYLS